MDTDLRTLASTLTAVAYFPGPSLAVSEDHEDIELLVLLRGPEHWQRTIGVSKWESLGETHHVRQPCTLLERQRHELVLEGHALHLKRLSKGRRTFREVTCQRLRLQEDLAHGDGRFAAGDNARSSAHRRAHAS